MGVGQDEGVEAFDPQVVYTQERAHTHVCIQSRSLDLHDMSLSFILHKKRLWVFLWKDMKKYCCF